MVFLFIGLLSHPIEATDFETFLYLISKSGLFFWLIYFRKNCLLGADKVKGFLQLLVHIRGGVGGKHRSYNSFRSVCEI
jgi:hypothetical protein